MENVIAALGMQGSHCMVVENERVNIYVGNYKTDVMAFAQYAVESVGEYEPEEEHRYSLYHFQ